MEVLVFSAAHDIGLIVALAVSVCCALELGLWAVGLRMPWDEKIGAGAKQMYTLGLLLAVGIVWMLEGIGFVLAASPAWIAAYLSMRIYYKFLDVLYGVKKKRSVPLDQVLERQAFLPDPWALDAVSAGRVKKWRVTQERTLSREPGRAERVLNSLDK